VHPVVVEAMRELDVDLSGAQPRLLTDDLARGAAMLITMGCGEACPHVAGVERDDWPLADPKDRPLDEVRAIRDDVARRVEVLVRSRGWARDPYGKCTP
jgi:arsenate reductase (thioredoxin)